MILKIVLPLTVISFVTFTKWWYAVPVDGPDTMFTGFPLAYSCPGWHTSMSLQIFLTEFIVDFMTYFLFWLALFFCVDRFVIKIVIKKWLTMGLWIVSVIIIAISTLLASNAENVFYIKRPFDIQVLETGYTFIWEQTQRPDYYKHFPSDK